MGLRTILVPMDGTPSGGAAMALALALGKEHNAHIEVLHVRIEAKSAVPLLGEGMSGAMIEEMIDLAEQEAKARALAARQQFDEARAAYDAPLLERPAAAGAGFSLWWNELSGREEDVLVRRARLFDLVVAGPAEDADHPSALLLHAALFESGRPVMVAPPDLVHWKAGTVAIAWNGSAEAARAVAAARPLLKRAAKVYLLAVEEEGEGNCARANDLGMQLAWHGIAAEAVCFSPAGHAVGAALMLEAQKLRADLMVMGAYTHSRVMQMILGGVTRHALGHAKLPLLMAH